MAVTKKSKKESDSLSDKLDVVGRLLVLQIKGDSSDSEMVNKLVKAKFKPAEIGKLLGISTSGVTSRIAQEKKKKTKRKGNGKKSKK